MIRPRIYINISVWKEGNLVQKVVDSDKIEEEIKVKQKVYI